VSRLLGTNRKRRALAIAVDVVLVASAYFLALTFRFEGRIPHSLGPRGSFLQFVLLAIVIHVMANAFSHAYRIMNRYIGLEQALRIAEACVVSASALIIAVLVVPASEHITPLTVVPVGGILAMVSMIGVRFYSRIFYERSLLNVRTDKNLLIVGAGATANTIIRELRLGLLRDTTAVGIVDDTASFKGLRLNDLPILGTLDDLARIIEDEDVTEVLIAFDSPLPDQVALVHRVCLGLGVKVLTMPTMAEIVEGQASLTYARELRIEDFLGRPPVAIDAGAIASYLKARRVLVTGAAGSIGSELCRQIGAFGPASLVLVDKDESGLYQLREELVNRGVQGVVIKPTSVALRAKMERLFRTYRPEIVFHAAAFKHVPLMELSPDEAVINNVRGTMVVAEAAARNGAELMVNISTDKAVDPSSVMGATKRVGEYLMQASSMRYPATRFRSVRFGNVLGSRGSVLPLFKQQIEAGGPVTITHPGMERYFMTIEEAVKLVLQAGALSSDELPSGQGMLGPFILEMGAPVSIVDLAHKMIMLLHGTSDDIFVLFTGLRPGEKLTEVLFCPDEQPLSTGHPMIRVAGRTSEVTAGGMFPAGFQANLRRLIALAEKDAPSEQIVEALVLCVPNYVPTENGPEEGLVELSFDLVLQDDLAIDDFRPVLADLAGR
jgi:FlaA1/EpsC-like NDP-sugar epimerase